MGRRRQIIPLTEDCAAALCVLEFILPRFYDDPSGSAVNGWSSNDKRRSFHVECKRFASTRVKENRQQSPDRLLRYSSGEFFFVCQVDTERRH